MSILRQNNYISGLRVDSFHLKGLESSICNDFDIALGKIVGGGNPLVVKGFTIATSDTAGKPAKDLVMTVAGGTLIHFGASESGSIYSVSDTESNQTLTTANTKTVGSFTANTTNYVGIDLVREADSTTTDLLKFRNPNTDEEISVNAPIARTLQFRIVISTQNFSSSSTLIPIAKVVTDSSNNVVSIQDSRPMMYRLGSGGDTALATYTHPWSTRLENSITYTAGSADPFTGEDKSISSMKSWMNAMMTSVWELRGGEKWYSPQHRDNVKVLYGPVATLSDNFEFTGTNIKWENISVAFENASTAGVYFNSVTSNTGSGEALGDGQCLYIDVDRSSNATNLIASVTSLTSLGSSTTPGRRYILAWRKGSSVYVRDRAYEVGRASQVASTTVLGVVKLSRAASTPAAPIVISDTGGTIVAPATNNTGLTVTGAGTGHGIVTTGGSTGNGIISTGGGSVGRGIEANGAGSGEGVWGVGGSSAAGVVGTGGTNRSGVEGYGTGTGTGVYGKGGITSGSVGVKGEGGNTNGIGVQGLGFLTGPGVQGTGGSTNAPGVQGTGGGTGGSGVVGYGKGTGEGVYGEGESGQNGIGVSGFGSGTGEGVRGVGVNGYGVLAQSDLTSPARSALRIVPQDTAPTIGEIGDIYVSSTGILYICTNATGPVWTKVGTQT